MAQIKKNNKKKPSITLMNISNPQVELSPVEDKEKLLSIQTSDISIFFPENWYSLSAIKQTNFFFQLK